SILSPVALIALCLMALYPVYFSSDCKHFYVFFICCTMKRRQISLSGLQGAFNYTFVMRIIVICLWMEITAERLLLPSSKTVYPRVLYTPPEICNF
ncbi:hypothetical protein XENOCAPTIV_014080, partial [Xenoophorus captivus]